MIDFYSSHILDDQARRSANLLAAILAKALDDLRRQPTSEERKRHMNLDMHAAKAVRFFNSEIYRHYASLIGINPDAYLRQLISGPIDKNNKRFTEKDYRIVRARLRWDNLPPHMLDEVDDRLEEESVPS